MSILLAIETSSSEYRVALGRDKELVYDSAQVGGHASRDIASLISDGLRGADAEISDVSGIAVNIGPGGLSFVRSGVSFANALSFSLGIPMYPFSTFQILGCEACKHTALPLLCAVPAANDTAYVGIVNGTAVQVMRFGPLCSAVAHAIDGLTEVAIAGAIRGRLSSLLQIANVLDTGIEKPNMGALVEMGYWARDQAGTPVFQVSPLTEQAPVFYE